MEIGVILEVVLADVKCWLVLVGTGGYWWVLVGTGGYWWVVVGSGPMLWDVFGAHVVGLIITPASRICGALRAIPLWTRRCCGGQR